MLTKRVKITIVTIVLSGGLFFFPLAEANIKLYLLAGLVVASYLLSVWSIFKDLKGFEFITLFVLPTFLTLSFALFINQFNPSTEIRLLLCVVYGVVLYTNLLAENIFNVSAERNIPLLRAARTVGYLVTLFVSFAFFSLIYGLGLPWWALTLISFGFGSLLFAQALWQVELEETLSRELILYSLVAGLIVAQLSAALSFWPLDPPKIGLAMTAMVYVVLGIMHHMLDKDLTRRATFEYVFVAFSVFLLLIVTTTWGI
ncbi:MAG TPA: hypothetical protein VLE47_00515 [Candidatus Saccharimonadales bacterium]|nr:hypothetical protein [Candidatus Saccharimonadales bacterium]